MNTLPLDKELVERLQKGDIEAFDMIYSRYSGKLCAFGLKYLKSKEESEELVQSVFLKLWENKENLKSELSFKSYLFTIAYNEICKLFRKRHYLNRFITDTLHENHNASSDTENGIDYKSFLERVQQIIDKLPGRQKEIFLRSRIDGESTKEIAEEVGLSTGTVDNYISEVLKIIRLGMRHEGF